MQLNELLSSPERDTHNDLSTLHNHDAIGLNSGEKSSLKNFTNWNHSKVINHSLANNKPLDQQRQKIHSDVQSSIQKAPGLQKPMTVHSGIDLARKKNLNLEVGKTVHTPAYTSTSLSHTNAGLHATKIKTPNGSEKHHLHFHLPTGYKNGIFVGHKDKIDGDHEYIMNHNQNWKVANHTVKKGVFGTQHHHWDLHPHTGMNEEIKAVHHNGERIGHIAFNKNGYWEGKRLDNDKIHKAKTEDEITKKLTEMTDYKMKSYKKAVTKRIGGITNNLNNTKSDFMKGVYQRTLDKRTKGLNMAKKRLGENTMGSKVWKNNLRSGIGVKNRGEQRGLDEEPEYHNYPMTYMKHRGDHYEVKHVHLDIPKDTRPQFSEPSNHDIKTHPKHKEMIKNGYKTAADLGGVGKHVKIPGDNHWGVPVKYLKEWQIERHPLDSIGDTAKRAIGDFAKDPTMTGHGYKMHRTLKRKGWQQYHGHPAVGAAYHHPKHAGTIATYGNQNKWTHNHNSIAKTGGTSSKELDKHLNHLKEAFSKATTNQTVKYQRQNKDRTPNYHVVTRDSDNRQHTFPSWERDEKSAKSHATTWIPWDHEITHVKKHLNEASNEPPNIQRLMYTQEEGTFLEMNVAQLVEFAKNNNLGDQKTIKDMASKVVKKKNEDVTVGDDDGNIQPIKGDKTMTGKPKDKVKTDVWQPDTNLSGTGVKSGV
jgi:hypothetical protein